MNTIILTLALLTQDRPQAPSEAQLNRFVFFAVLEGLFEDALPEDAVKLILRQDKGEYVHFIKGCPICTPAVEAFRAYASRSTFYFERKGEAYLDKSPADLEPILKEIHEKKDQGHYNTGLDKLMKRFIARRLAAIPQADRPRWEAALKIGQEKMKNTYDHCPWCAGAADPK